jgi:MFS family permease
MNTFSYTRRNALINIFGETLWGLKANLVVPSVILAVLLYTYGASPEVIGAISAIETSTLLLPQLAGGYLFHARARRKVHLVLWHFFVMLPFNLVQAGLTFFANLIDPALYRTAMLASFALYTAAIGVVAASWFEYFIGTIYEPGIRGTVMGISTFGASISGTAGALFAGWLIRSLPLPDAYAWLYVISWAIGMCSISLFLLIKDPAALSTEIDAEKRPTPRSLVESMREGLSVSNFRRYLAGRTLAISGFGVVPFIAVYYASEAGGNLPKDFVVSCFSAFTLANAAGSLLIGRIGDRFGHRPGIIFGASMQVIALSAAVLLPNALGCILTYACAGLTSSCAFVAHYNLVLEMCVSKNRVAHISMANLIIGVPASLAPLLAGVAAREWGIPALFVGSALISLVAVAWFSLCFIDPRKLKERAAQQPSQGVSS